MPPESLLQFTRDQLRALRAHPRKRLSQNFLIDPTVLDDILAAARLTPDDVVIEVGPGLGALTDRLVETAAVVIAIEYDPVLAAGLQKRLAGHRNLVVLNQDVLGEPPEAVLARAGLAPAAGLTRRYPPYQVVANLPYHITSPAIRQFLWSAVPPERLILMVQKEVAQRIAAAPGKLSLLAVMVQVYADPELIAVVPPRAFLPEPEVESAILRLITRREPAVPIDDREAFLKIVAAGFSHARKQIHNALARGTWLPPDSAEAILRAAGVDPMRRAQSLTLEEWFRVYQTVRQVRDESKGESKVQSPKSKVQSPMSKVQSPMSNVGETEADGGHGSAEG